MNDKAAILLLTLLVSSSTSADYTTTGYCGEKLLLGNGNIPDNKFSASTAWGTMHARNARLEDSNARAWCIYQPDGRDYIEVQLDRMYRITGIQTKGRYGNGVGQEKTEAFEVSYLHALKGPERWLKWKDYRNTTMFTGNTNTYEVKQNKFNPNILGAWAVRIHPRATKNAACLQFELLGCEWKEKLTSYEIPHPGVFVDSVTRRARTVPGLLDNTYDGERKRNKLVNGLGQLSDHITGNKDLTKTNTATSEDSVGYDYIGWYYQAGGPLSITFRFDQLRSFSALHIYYASYNQYRLWDRMEVEIFYNGSQLKSSLPYWRKNFARTTDSGIFQVWFGGDASGKFLRLKFPMVSGMAVLLSEVVFVENVQTTISPATVPTNRKTGQDRMVSPNGAGRNTDQKDPSKAGGLPLGLVIAIIVSLTLLVAASTFTVFYLKKRRRQAQPRRNNYTHVTTSRCDGTINGAGDVAMVTSRSSDNHALTTDDYSFAQDSENQNIYQEISHSENVYLLPVDSIAAAAGSQSHANTSQQRAPPTFPFIPPPLPDHPPPDFPVPRGATKKSQHDDEDEEHEKGEEETRSDQESPPEDFEESTHDLPNYAEVELNQAENESIQGIAGNALYAVPWDQNQDPKLFELLASSSVENLLSDDTSGVQWSDDRIRKLEFPRDRLVFIEKLGEGQFGEVHLCRADKSLRQITDGMTSIEDNDVDGHVMVAAKILHHDAPRDTKECFLKEVRVMSRLRHENIVRLLAVCTKNEPFAMLTEYMCKGDLNLYLKKFDVEIPRLKNHQQADKNKLISNKRLLRMIMQIASGMKYLASINFVHRDLATRNCLVGHEEMIRISDFGMSRNMYQSDYYKIQGRAILPIRWMSWESLLLGKFSSASDVWAFATTLWEMFSLCKHQPYSELDNQQVVDNLKAMYRRDQTPMLLPRPRRCPAILFAIMRRCWHPEITKRPDFNEIFHLLQEQEKNGWRVDTGAHKVKKPDKPPIPLPRSATNPRRSNIDDVA